MRYPELRPRWLWVIVFCFVIAAWVDGLSM